jgi:hypothetical protein
MRQHSGHTGTRQTCGVKQEQCAVECERSAMDERAFRRESSEEKESKDSQMILSLSAQHALYATH